MENYAPHWEWLKREVSPSDPHWNWLKREVSPSDQATPIAPDTTTFPAEPLRKTWKITSFQHIARIILASMGGVPLPTACPEAAKDLLGWYAFAPVELVDS